MIVVLPTNLSHWLKEVSRRGLRGACWHNSSMMLPNTAPATIMHAHTDDIAESMALCKQFAKQEEIKMMMYR
jgi:hypothetical protein